MAAGSGSGSGSEEGERAATRCDRAGWMDFSPKDSVRVTVPSARAGVLSEPCDKTAVAHSVLVSESSGEMWRMAC